MGKPDPKRFRSGSGKVGILSQKVNTPSLMRATDLKAVRQTINMVLDSIEWLSDNDLDRIFAKICLEKLRREAKVMITVYGGK